MKKLFFILLCAVVMQASATNALLIVGSTSPLSDADSVVNYKLGLVFDTVTLKLASSSVTGDASGKQLIFISSSVASGDVTTKFTNSAVPLIACEHAVFDDLKLTANGAGDHGSEPTETMVHIILPAHPLAAGLDDTVTVHGSSQTLTWGLPNSNAVHIATVLGNVNRVVIFGYESGASMVGLTAPARRVGFYFNDISADVYTADGEDLFDAAINWAAGLSPSGTPPTVTITAPAQGATYTTPADITITADASDSDGTIDEVEFFYNSTSIGTDNSSPYSIVWNDAPAGNYLLTAVATDNDNLKDTSVAVNISVLEDGVWFTSGNTVGGSEFIGTLNDEPFVIKADDESRIVVDPHYTDVTGWFTADTINCEELELYVVGDHVYKIRTNGSYRGGISMGYGDQSEGAFSLGSFTSASGEYSIATGVGSDAVGGSSIAMGNYSESIGNYSVAFGNMCIADGHYSNAIGNESLTNDNHAWAVGDSAQANGKYSFAFGDNPIADADHSLAFGEKALADGTYSVAIGRSVQANGMYSLSFGQVDTADGDYSFALGRGSRAFDNYAFAMGNGCRAIDAYSIALGNHCKAELGSFAMGEYSQADNASFAVGTLASATGTNSFAFGGFTRATGNSSVTFGDYSKSEGIASIAMGNQINIEPYAHYAVGIGHWIGIDTSAANSYSFGSFLRTNHPFSMTLGVGIAEDPGPILSPIVLENDLPGSFMIGMLSDVPTLIVGPGDDTPGSIGNVGIGTGNNTLPGNRLEINKGVADSSGLRFTQLTSSSTPSSENGLCLSVDANGDVILVPTCCEAPEERNALIEEQRSIIEELRNALEQQRTEFSTRIADIESKLNTYMDGGVKNVHAHQTIDLNEVQVVVLEQNVPNPFAEQTTISYFIPEDAGRAVMQFTDLSGRVIKTVELQKGNGTLTVFAQTLGTGTYAYSLVIDGKVMETKKMMKTR